MLGFIAVGILQSQTPGIVINNQSSTREIYAGKVESMENYGALFKESRERAGLTQVELAKRLGFTSAQYISNIERNLCLPALEHYRTLSKVLGKPVSRMLLETEIEIRSQQMRSAALKW